MDNHHYRIALIAEKLNHSLCPCGKSCVLAVPSDEPGMDVYCRSCDINAFIKLPYPTEITAEAVLAAFASVRLKAQ